ncbi:hypothetical protein LTR66_005073 [Elasticomyces elasticus]|nr:hypothetical protein LTR66_005073 [Elasticomyces elasticus]
MPLERVLVVGIDFGTTFSGAAASYSEKPDTPDDICVIKSWPGGTGTSEKVPSEISYGPFTDGPASKKKGPASLKESLAAMSIQDKPSGPAFKWGFQLRPDEPRLRCIKLFLDRGQNIPSYVSKADVVEKLFDADRDTTDVVADYLSELYKHAKEALVRRYGEVFMSTTKMRFVLTVPAVWSDKAKNATMQAAERAGIHEDLSMITEPEAAAVYALQAIQPNPLLVGDNFVVCDAGGGTVDLISYEIKQLSPALRIEESATGTGGLCGAVFLNLRFEAHCRDKMGAQNFDAMRTQKPKSWISALNYFEEYVKRKFDPKDTNEFFIPLPGMMDDEDAGIDSGFLCLESEEIASIFEPVIADVIKLVEGQVNVLFASGRRVSGIILVGGFGQSSYLFNRLKARFDNAVPFPSSSHEATNNQGSAITASRIEVMQPAHAWTAVVRGAVLRGLEGTDPVVSRCARRYYGVTCSDYYQPGKHPSSAKYWEPMQEIFMIDMEVTWFITKGQTVSSTDPICFWFSRVLQPGDSRIVVDDLITCDDDTAPDWYDAGGHAAKILCTLETDLSTVPEHFWKEECGPSGQIFHRLDHQLGMQIESGGLKFDLRVNGVTYGSVVAEFK